MRIWLISVCLGFFCFTYGHPIRQADEGANWIKDLTKNSLTVVSRVTDRCFFADGLIFEQGVARPLTEQEKAQVELFEYKMLEWQQQFNDKLVNWGQQLSAWNPFAFADGKVSTAFPTFPTVPVIPQSPCFCANCNVPHHEQIDAVLKQK